VLQSGKRQANQSVVEQLELPFASGTKRNWAGAHGIPELGADRPYYRPGEPSVSARRVGRLKRQRV